MKLLWMMKTSKSYNFVIYLLVFLSNICDVLCLKTFFAIYFYILFSNLLLH